jgi:hypothetical protein
MQNQRKEPTYTRRGVIALAGAVVAGAAVGGAAYLWPAYEPKWLTSDDTQRAHRSELRFIGQPTDVYTLDQRIEESIRTRFVQDATIQRMWHEKGGKDLIDINLANVTRIAAFMPEERKAIADEYKEYVDYALSYIFGAFGKQSEKPQVCVPKTSFDTPQIAAIVRNIVTLYQADVTLTDKRISMTIPKVEMIVDEETLGSDSFDLNLIWELSVNFKVSAMLLAIQGPAYVRMQTPVTEGLHRIAKHGSKTLMDRYVTNPWPKDGKELAQIVDGCSEVEEGVVHAVSHILTPQIARAFGLKVNEPQREEKIQQEHSQPQYRHVACISSSNARYES